MTAKETQNTAAVDSSAVVSGTVHIYVAFDLGDEVDLEAARRLLVGQPQALARRRRTPSSFAYSPPPLRFPLEPIELKLQPTDRTPHEKTSERTESSAAPQGIDAGQSDEPHESAPTICRSSIASAEATLFDFGGVSVAMHLPISLTIGELSTLATCLADSDRLVEQAKSAAQWLFERLRPAIVQPAFNPLTEEYVVFQLPPGLPLPPPHVLLEQWSEWAAGMARLENEPLSGDEVAAALHSFISYSPRDLLVPEWSAALLIDSDCDETLQTIEFANLQLLEYRFIDKLLDDRLADAYRLIHPLTRSWLPLWRTHSRPLRALGELRIHANSLFERTGNALKLVGDQYLARVYRILAARFHLDDWERSIQRSLEVVESVYRVLADQAATYRTELLEVVVIVLIVFEIVMALFRR
ncbi:MAG TPA: hypothetical protein VGY55_12680 [Pirellulales bacterium]|jgi:hypothetical protein|nr:hypothetical protein [Pirellulales bacterium]